MSPGLYPLFCVVDPRCTAVQERSSAQLDNPEGDVGFGNESTGSGRSPQAERNRENHHEVAELQGGEQHLMGNISASARERLC